LRDRALGVAQRIARLAAGFFLDFQRFGERLDAAAQRFEVFFFRRPPCRGGEEAQ
jgi:hypothetical protein